MLVIFLLLLLLVIFDIAAMRWGADSRDGLKSEEWERRRRHTHVEARVGIHSSPYEPEWTASAVSHLLVSNHATVMTF